MCITYTYLGPRFWGDITREGGAHAQNITTCINIDHHLLWQSDGVQRVSVRRNFDGFRQKSVSSRRDQTDHWNGARRSESPVWTIIILFKPSGNPRVVGSGGAGMKRHSPTSVVYIFSFFILTFKQYVSCSISRWSYKY